MSKNNGSSPKKGKRKIRRKPKSTETVKESLLLYQIKVKEHQLEELTFEVKFLEDDERRHLDRIYFLIHEKDILFKKLANHAKSKKLSQNEVTEIYTKDVALNQLKKNMESREHLKRELEDLEKGNLEVDGQIKEQRIILEEILEYRDHGRHEVELKLRRIDREIEEERNKQAFMLDQLQKEFHIVNEKLNKEALESMRKLKIDEADRAVRNLTRPEVRVLSTNEWLMKEVEIYRDVVGKTNIEVLKLEEESEDLLRMLQEKNITVAASLRKKLDLLGLKSKPQATEEEAMGENEQQETTKWPVTRQMLLNRLNGS